MTLRRFQVRWANIPGMEKPVQPLEVFYTGAYAQDEWRLRDDVKVTAGIRFDVPFFGKTGFANANADALSFEDENGAIVHYSTAKLPDAKLLWSPRVGFNWNVNGTGLTQLRGGTGVFTGRPAYVWISNQIGNTGVLTGFEQLDNTRLRPFSPDPNRYKPATVTGAPASSYELALTDPNFKFPQVWRTNIALDQRIAGWTATGEFLYNRDVNGVYYINANLADPIGNFNGVDSRPRWGTGSTNRINANVANAIVLKNQNVGRSWNASGSLERNLRSGLWVKGAYTYGESKNTVDPGSIAFGSWSGNAHSGNPNNPGIAYASASPGHRVFLAASYTKDYFSFGGTSVSVFWQGNTQGNTSFTISGDLNNDGGTSNDLVYIPRDTSEMNFQSFTASGRTFTPAEQAAAFEQFIQSDSYLSAHRGEYAKRGAVFLPMVYRMDLSVSQNFYARFAGKRHEFQVRMDALNFTNLINKNWGLGQRLVTSQPLTNPGIDSQGRATYRLRVINNQLVTKSLEQTANLNDVYRIQLSLRYLF